MNDGATGTTAGNNDRRKHGRSRGNQLRSTKWRALAPTLIFFIGTLAAVLIRGRDDPEQLLQLSVLILVPLFLLAFIAYWAVEGRSRAKSSRTWQVMEQRHPGEAIYLFHVLPRTRSGLERLGVPTRRPSLTYPVIGVVFGPEVTFWEEGKSGWSLRIAYANIEAIELGSTDNGVRSWPAIRLLLIDHDAAAEPGSGFDHVPRRGELVLALQHRGHKKLSNAVQTNLVDELNSRLVRV